MTQEEKQLLLKDLCARLPYGVKCRQHKLDSQVCTMYPEHLKNAEDVEEYEPYLRSMSSMTEEEKEIVNNLIYDEEGAFLSPVPIWVINESDIEEYVDFCNSHHLDWRNLIPMGLALEAHNGMYKTE